VYLYVIAVPQNTQSTPQHTQSNMQALNENELSKIIIGWLIFILSRRGIYATLNGLLKYKGFSPNLGFG